MKSRISPRNVALARATAHAVRVPCLGAARPSLGAATAVVPDQRNGELASIVALIMGVSAPAPGPAHV